MSQAMINLSRISDVSIKSGPNKGVKIGKGKSFSK